LYKQTKTTGPGKVNFGDEIMNGWTDMIFQKMLLIYALGFKMYTSLCYKLLREKTT